jgi:hypothetical protein
MKEYYGNHLGICINSQDPEYRGRVQIFIPHIMPALYEGWNELGLDVTIECVGNNLPNGLRSDVIEKLKLILPWAESASPIVGASVGGSYNPATGNFNQTSLSESAAAALRNNAPLDSEAFKAYAAELQDPAVRQRLFTLMEAEVGGQGTQSQLAWLETVRNRASVQNTTINNIITNTAYYQPYKDGGFGRAEGRLTDAKINTYSGLLNQTLAGSNITNGATHNASAEVAANAVSQYNAVPSSIVNIGGETYYSKTYEQNKVNSLLSSSSLSLSLSSPTTGTTPSQPPTTPFWQNPQAAPYTLSNPSSQASVQTSGATNPAAAGGFANAFRNNVLGSDGQLRGPGGVTLCGVGTRKAVGLALGDSYYTNTGVGSTAGSANTNYWTAKGDYARTSLPAGYLPRQGDVLVHQKNLTGTSAGHAQVYLDGQWHSWRSGDTVTKYLGLGGQTSTLFRLTPQGEEKLRAAGAADPSLIGKDGQLIDTKGAGDNNGYEGGRPTNIVGAPSPTQIIPTNTTGMPAGVFAIPSPGSMLWVFFREGNPMFPVYFAASFGRQEWQNAYQANSQPGDYGAVSVSRTGIADITITNNNLENSYTRHASHGGSYNEFNKYGQDQYCNGSKNTYVNGWFNIQTSGRQYCNLQDDTKIVFGNTKTFYGNPAQENIDAMTQLEQYVKEINAPLLEGGTNDPNQQQTASTSQLPARGSTEFELQKLNLEELQAIRDSERRMAELEKQLNT